MSGLGRDGGTASVAAWGRALLPVPRLALLLAGTLVQTAAFTVWLAAPDGPTGALAVVAGTGFLIAVALFIGAGVLPAERLASVARARRYPLAIMPLVVLLGLALAWTATLGGDALLRAPLDPAHYDSDAASFIHFDADLVRHGINPYTADARFWQAVARFPQSAATPLRRGAYADLTWAPSYARVRHDLAAQVASLALRHGEFAPASLHSYPALAILAFVPVIWAGAGSTLPMSLLTLLALLALIGLRLPSGQRTLGSALLLANSVAVLLTLRGSFEALALVPLLLAWQWLGRTRWSPVLLGLACAVKQTVWLLAPLYLLQVARRAGWRTALTHGGLAAGAFLAPNLPFILADPRAWAASMGLPLTLPAFPDGVGLMAFTRAGLLPLLPPVAYGLMQLALLVVLGAWVLRAARPPRAELVLLLGSLLLALGWRSLVSYFIWLPAVALFAALPLLRADLASAAGRDATAALAPVD